MDRPAISGRTCAGSGKSASSVEMRWLPGDVGDNLSNQYAEMAVSTLPLLGTGWSMTTSKAEIRSLVTIR